MERPSWVTEDVDLDGPRVARVYDYMLGGSHNFAVDRDLAAKLLLLAPDAADVMRANRAFLGRAVRFMASRGVTQFLDIGSGIPTVGNVHETAQRTNPTTRVVYVDIDPVAVAHSRVMVITRSAAEIASLFGNFPLVEPGLVFLPHWRPDSPDVDEHPERFVCLAGVGQKP